MNQTLVWSRSKVLALAVLMTAITLLFTGINGIHALAAGDLPNPDSYYRLVLLEDHTGIADLGFAARDNAPAGLWSHWSLPYPWTVWQLHHLPMAFGLDERTALLWTGAAVTIGCMLGLSVLLALTIMAVGTRRGAMVAALMLACSTGLFGYGRVDQITHHIFMLMPLAGAALCLLRPASGTATGLAGGGLLGLALWISPETMPFVTGLIVIRTSMRLQHAQSGAIWPVALGLVTVTLCGWLIDPPPPSFSRWALDHLSYAWLLYVALVGGLILLAEACGARRMPLSVSLFLLIAASAAAGYAWLVSVPGALDGPAGLIPAELKPLWWDHIQELQPADTAAKITASLAPPLCGALICAWIGWRERSLWLLMLAGMALVYGLLGIWHGRMAAAAALIGAIAFGIGISRLHSFADVENAGLPFREQCAAFLLALAGPLQLAAALGLVALEPDRPAKKGCPLQPVEQALAQFPSSTMLAPIFSGPELLYRSHHRIIAGPYHHNIDGILDSYRAWLDTQDAQAMEIVRRRKIDYVLACTDYQSALRAPAPARSLAQRTADGDVPAWLTPVPWPAGLESNWRLYRVQLATSGNVPSK